MNDRRFSRKVFLLAAVLTLALLLAGTAVASSPAQTAPTAQIDTYALNVRAGPSVAYRVVAVTSYGQQVTLLGRNDAATWAKIRLASGTEGWVNASYLVPSVSIASLSVAGVGAPTPTGVVNTGAVHVRAGPGVAYASRAIAYQGTSVTLLGRNSAATWVKARLPGGLEGWIGAYLLDANVAVAGLPVASVGAPTPTGVVNTGAVHVRSGPGIVYASRAIAYQGTSVTLLGRNSAATWVRARLPGGLEGWIGAYLLDANVAITDLPVVGAATPPAAATGWVNTGALNVRAGPGVGYSVLTAIPWGTNVSLLGRAAHVNWVKIRLGSGLEGWVNASYLQTNVSVASLPVIS
ncbi:MAG: SH3 domain-containing protein [Candidatus Promineifilaceae bacterium]|nr:SH3 domain-containing protein [Candidatus Promineifilaceae bacterium]